jgi:hypothetical protein
MDEADEIPVYEAPPVEQIDSPDTRPRRGIEPAPGGVE